MTRKRLRVGKKIEYFIRVEEVTDKGVSVIPKVTYQDAFENEYTDSFYGTEQ